MEIRKLRREEMPEAGLISAIAFHARVTDYEAQKREIMEGYKNDNWGAFAPDGTMMARMINSRFTMRFDGHNVPIGGIGAVSTLPEYRNSGAIRRMYDQILPLARAEGEVFSTLYPFNHAFYRKFGYELSHAHSEYEFPLEALKGHRFGGWAKLWKPGEPVAPFVQIYNQFAAPYNLSFVRDDAGLSNHVRGTYYKDRRFCYLLGDGDGPCAYLVFDDVYEGGTNRINAADAAFLGRRGLMALLGFLARFTADYKSASLRLPGDVNLCALVDDPYGVTRHARHGYMARVVNAQRALALMKKPADAAFTIEIQDELLPENAGTWLVRGDAVERTREPADLWVSALALSPMVLGYAPLSEAEYRKDVEIRKNREVLERVFVKKATYIADHF